LKCNFFFTKNHELQLVFESQTQNSPLVVFAQFIGMRIILLFIVFSAESVRLIDVIAHENNEVSSYVRDLITDFNRQEPATKDVAILKFNVDLKSTQNVDDVFEDIRRAIPNENPVLVPKMERIVHRNLPDMAFIIIVSEVGNDVS
jgi:hypothetical protein